MNRHNKFYSQLSEFIDEYGDDYYEEEDEEYDEEGGDEYYGDEEGDDNGYGPGYDALSPVSAPGAPVANPHTTINPAKDADYELLDAALPALHTAWQSKAPMQLPLAEAEAVRALRECEYDANACVSVLIAKRKAEREKSGGAAKVLTVTSTKKAGDIATLTKGSATAGAAADEDTHSDEESGVTVVGTNRSSSATTARGSKGRKTKKDQYVDVQPDLTKPDCTFVVAGHVDAGKSTTLGHLLLLLGRVDASEVKKNEKEGRGVHKESFRYAWLLDQSEEERRRGVTIDAGSHCFETPHRRIHVLDAPGHKDFVLNMISSATQADAAMLVVTAAPSEFETGLQFGTKEHLMILKTLGVGCIIVVVNKMDAARYSKERYDFVVSELKLLLKQLRLREDVIIGYVPISGMEGTNIVTLDHKRMPWYEGSPLIELLDNCSLSSRLIEAPLRLSLQDVQGSTLYARVESGRISRGTAVRFVPCDVLIDVRSIDKPTVSGAVNVAFAGDTVEISTPSSLIGLYPGCVGIPPDEAYRPTTDFEAHVQTFPTLAKVILPGATFTLCVHALTVPVRVIMLVSKMDGKGSWSKGMVKCVPASTQALVIFRAELNIAVMPAEDCQALGRFVLQQDGDTVAGGLIKRVLLA